MQYFLTDIIGAAAERLGVQFICHDGIRRFHSWATPDKLSQIFEWVENSSCEYTEQENGRVTICICLYIKFEWGMASWGVS